MIHSLVRNTIVICGILLFVASCTITKKPSPTDSDMEKITIPLVVEGCNAVARIKNFTSEPGCQYLLQLLDGTLLLPGELPTTDVPFYEGAGVKIGYEVLDKDESVVGKSICEHHEYIVRINCIEEYVIPQEGMPTKHDDCLPIKNPYKYEWMRNGITQHKPSRVNEYSYEIGYLYEFRNDQGSILYDCLGNLMCNTSESQDCQSILETLGKPKAIMSANN